MSHGCNSDVVPYIKHNVFDKEVNRDNLYNDPTFSTLLMPEAVSNLECDWQKDEDIPNMEVLGWKYTGWKFIGKHKQLAADVWEKDGTIVYLLNQSQYSNVGYYNIAIVADEKKSIELFVADFKDLISYDWKIEGPNESAEWWA